jgi:hypothetical protein
MKGSRYAIPRLMLVILVVASSLLISASSAFANVRLPGGTVPFYARISRSEIYHTDDWAAIVFYRPSGCIPPSFNLLDFFDIPAAFECTPPTTDGFEIWANGPDIDPTPKLAELHGLGAVPVWFVSWPDLETAIADDVLTIGELVSLDPLVGSASSFHETLRPTLKASTLELDARGLLEDGRSFQFNAQAATHPGEVTECGIHCLARIVFK